jgi:hypothetical protein
MANNLGTPVSFNNAPDMKFPRSRFKLDYRVNTGGNAGFLIPLGEPIEVLPGDTFSIDIAHLTRMSPTINVPLENVYLDCFFFYCKNADLWEHWQEFISGENKTSAWVPSTSYSVPQIKINPNSSTWNYIAPDTILSYMGLPTCAYDNDSSRAVSAGSISALPVRGFCQIFNEYFRDEFLQNPLLVPKGDSDVNYSTSVAYQTSAVTGGALPPVCKLPDLFTTCKPMPQYGNPVRIPSAPVITSANDNDISLFTYDNSLKLKKKASASATSWTNPSLGQVGVSAQGIVGPTGSSTGSINAYFQPTNLVTLGPTIEELRVAILTQGYLERLLRGGARYREFIYSFFNTKTDDLATHIPEYLGGKTFNINVSPVVQTSETNNTPQGHVSGYSSSSGKASIFTRSFTEHGWIIPVMCYRYQHTYAQGISKMWKKKSALEFYLPVFNDIGYVPVMDSEIYTGELAHSGNAAVPFDSSSVFGYQEAWYEYRYRQDKNVGMMRLNNYTDRYGDSWSVGDIYSSVPSLSSSWIAEDMNNLNRVLAVTGTSTVPQFISNFFVKCTAVRCMKPDSVPGLGLRI